MDYKIFILIGMIFCHIVDDYYLQGWLASGKQKGWWIKNYSNPLYKYDYIAALFMHSFSWAFSITILPTLYALFLSKDLHFMIFISIFVANILIHMFVDDLKANKKKINLVQDQLVYIVQAGITWFCLMF